MTTETEIETMASYKMIKFDEIDIENSTPNYGQYDPGRYDEDNEEMQNLMHSLMLAGRGERAMVLDPITVYKSTGTGMYLLERGFRRYYALCFLKEQGKEIPEQLQAKILNKEEAADHADRQRIAWITDTTQSPLKSYAEGVALWEILNTEKFVWFEAQGIDPEEANDTQHKKAFQAAKDALMKAMGIDIEDKNSAGYKAAKFKFDLVNRFQELPGILQELASENRITIRVADQINARLGKVAKEIASLKKQEEQETWDLLMDGLLEAFPEKFSWEGAEAWLNSEKERASLEQNAPKILKGVPPEVKEAYESEALPIEAVNALKKQSSTSGHDIADIYSKASELAAENPDPESGEIAITEELIHKAVEALEEEEEAEEKESRTWVEIQSLINNIKKGSLKVSIDDSWTQEEVTDFYDVLVAADKRIKTWLSAREKRASKAARDAQKNELLDSAAEPDAA